MTIMQKFTTAAAAADYAGVSESTIGNWRRRGWIGQRPWSAAELDAAPTHGERGGKPHGTEARWRSGCRCSECTQAHAGRMTEYRQRRRLQELEEAKPIIFRALREGEGYRGALDIAGVTARKITGWRTTIPGFADELDAVLTETRDPSLRHGTATSWKAGCRCPECTAYHDATRSR